MSDTQPPADNVVPLTAQPAESGIPVPGTVMPGTEVTARRPAQNLPGCGLALFVMLLAGFFCVGATSHGVSIFAVLSSADALRSSKLVYGGNVDPRTLMPMRDAGGIRQDEIPDAFHAETADGTRACAISGGRVVRVDDGAVTAIPLAEITRVVPEQGAVAVHGATASVVCTFEEGEGGDRFARMLLAR